MITKFEWDIFLGIMLIFLFMALISSTFMQVIDLPPPPVARAVAERMDNNNPDNNNVAEGRVL